MPQGYYYRRPRCCSFRRLFSVLSSQRWLAEWSLACLRWSRRLQLSGGGAANVSLSLFCLRPLFCVPPPLAATEGGWLLVGRSPRGIAEYRKLDRLVAGCPLLPPESPMKREGHVKHSAKMVAGRRTRFGLAPPPLAVSAWFPPCGKYRLTPPRPIDSWKSFSDLDAGSAQQTVAGKRHRGFFLAPAVNSSRADFCLWFTFPLLE